MWLWRLGHAPTEEQRAKESSPIFLQFLACVSQLIRDFPCAFEFNSDFLVTLHRVSTWGVYGTFASNEPRERSDLRVDEQTFSVWYHFLDMDTRQRVRDEFVNPLFDPNLVSMCLWDSQVGWKKECNFESVMSFFVCVAVFSVCLLA
jgi:hypothetical protein